MPTWLRRALALGSIAFALCIAIGDLAHNGPSGSYAFDFYPAAPAYRITHIDPRGPPTARVFVSTPNRAPQQPRALSGDGDVEELRRARSML